MEELEYKKKVEIAKKAVEGLGLDENLKLRAFDKVLDNLLGNSPKQNKHAKRSSKKIKRKQAPIKNYKSKEKEEVISLVNAEDFPYIHSLSSKLDMILYILKVFRDKYNKDGLIPSQISKILVEKFRIKADQFNISRKLSISKEFLDRDKVLIRGGFAYKYKIMKKGEDHINRELLEIKNKKSGDIHETKEEETPEENHGS